MNGKKKKRGGEWGGGRTTQMESAARPCGIPARGSFALRITEGFIYLAAPPDRLDVLEFAQRRQPHQQADSAPVITTSPKQEKRDSRM